MDVSIIGTGYVGLSAGVGFAVRGNSVICVDIDRQKVEQINDGVSPIYEPLLDDYLKKVLKEKKFAATTDLKEAISKTSVSFISVGTPSREDGSIDLKYVSDVSRQIGEVLKKKGTMSSSSSRRSSLEPPKTSSLKISKRRPAKRPGRISASA